MSECTGPSCTHPEHGKARHVIVKHDGNGQPVYADDPRLGNRAERRALVRTRTPRRATP